MAGELTPAELAARRNGLGGSDAGPVFGYGYGTRFTVWCDKTYGYQQVVTPSMQRGHDLEHVVADKAEARHRLARLEPCDGQAWSSQYPWLFTTLDYADVDDGTVVECKVYEWRHSKDAWGPDGSGPDGLPPSILLQAHHQLAVATWADRVIVAVLFVDTWELRSYVVERSATIHDLLIEGEQQFWEGHVLAGVPPAISDPKRDLAAARAIPVEDRQAILDADAERWLSQWADARAARLEADKAVKEAQAELAQRMVSANKATFDGYPAVTRSINKNGVLSTTLANASRWRTTQ